MHCIFGTDDKPFISHMSIYGKKLSTLPTPLNLPLLCYMSGVKINKDEIFLCGGITSSLSSISRKSYIYNIKTNKAKALP